MASGKIFGYLNIWNDFCMNSERIFGRIFRLLLGGLSAIKIGRILGMMPEKNLARTPRSTLVEKL